MWLYLSEVSRLLESCLHCKFADQYMIFNPNNQNVMTVGYIVLRSSPHHALRPKTDVQNPFSLRLAARADIRPLSQRPARVAPLSIATSGPNALQERQQISLWQKQTYEVKVR